MFGDHKFKEGEVVVMEYFPNHLGETYYNWLPKELVCVDRVALVQVTAGEAKAINEHGGFTRRAGQSIL